MIDSEAAVAFNAQMTDDEDRPLAAVEDGSDQTGLVAYAFQRLQSLPRQKRVALFLLLFCTITLLYLVPDHDFSLYGLYLIPVLYAMWFLENRWAHASCAGSVLIWLIHDLIHGELRHYSFLSYWNLFVRAAVLVIVATVVERLKAAVEKQNELKQQQVERELELAHEVQLRLLPSKPPSFSDLDLSYVYQPARVIGGDYYDFVPLTPERLGIVVADVAGKGLPSALLMASLEGLVHNAPELCQGDLSCLAKALNTSLFDITASNRYATVLLGIVDTATGMFEYVNAGNNPPLLFRNSSPGRSRVESLDHSGLPLGMFPKSVYHNEQVPFRAGDVLVLYTDGVTDAQNSAGDEFGVGRLRETVAEARDFTAAEITDRIKRRLAEFVGLSPQFDDITVMVVKSRISRDDDGLPAESVTQSAPTY